MKNILMIGASSDVGLEYLKQLGETSQHICAFAHYNSSDSKLIELASACQTLDIHTIQADLSQSSGAERLVEALTADSFIPDAFIYLPAPAFSYRRIKEYEAGCLDAAIGLGADSFLSLAKAVLPLMKKQGGNVLVMLTSYVLDELPPKFMCDYIVGKYALLGAMKAAAAEYGSEKLHINAIAPEMMDTKFLKGIDERIIEMNRSQAPAGRLLTPEDLLPVMDELLSESCDKNGECVRIDLPAV